jgi:hypothetical protein
MEDLNKENAEKDDNNVPSEDSKTVIEENKKLVEENKKLFQDLNNTVEELKELRTKKEALVPKDVVDEKIQNALLDDKKKQVSVNLEQAKKKFQNDFKQYHQENDPNGIKKNLLDNAFKRINTSEHYSVEELYDDLVFAHKGISSEDENRERNNPFSSTVREFSKPKVSETEEAKLSDSDISFANGIGIKPDALKNRLTNRLKEK